MWTKKVLKYAGIAGGTMSYLIISGTAFAQSEAIKPITEGGSFQDIITIIDTVVGWMFGLAGALAVAYLVYAGIQYITGGAKGAETAKSAITNAIIGIAVIVLAYVIINAVITLLKSSIG